MQTKTFSRLAGTVLLLALLLYPGAGRFHAAGAPSPSALQSPGPIYLPALFRPGCAGFSAPIVARPAHFPRSSLSGYIGKPANCQVGLPPASPVITTGVIDADPIPGGRFVWVFVYASNSRYYPQCIDALHGRCGVEQSDSAWQVISYLGRAGLKEHFHLVLVELNQTGQDFLVPRMQEWAQADSFPGLAPTELDTFDVKELHSIQVETAGQ
jgi:hypothetical protein